MKIMYIGKKKGIHLTFAWLSATVMMVPRKPVDVADDDGLRLINDYPETFQEWKPDPLEEFIKQNNPDADKDDEDKAGGVDDIDFEIADGKYLCPFCEKTYAANEAGKPWLVKHLEKDHAEAWAKALAEARAEAAGNQEQ